MEKTKLIIFFVVLLLLCPNLWSDDDDKDKVDLRESIRSQEVDIIELEQKKYSVVPHKPDDSANIDTFTDVNILMIDGQPSVLIPYELHDTFVREGKKIEGKPKNHIMVGKDEVVALPYLIVPESEFEKFLKKQTGIVGKPKNHVMIEGKETVLLSSKEIQTNIGYYRGVKNKPDNFVVIGRYGPKILANQVAIIIKPGEYNDYIKGKKSGYEALPSNYIRMGEDNRIVIVIPANDEDYLVTAVDAVKKGNLAIDELKKLGSLPGECPQIVFGKSQHR